VVVEPEPRDEPDDDDDEPESRRGGLRYLDEESFRFNEREATDARRFRKAMAGVTGKRLTYKKLTGKLGLDSGRDAVSVQ